MKSLIAFFLIAALSATGLSAQDFPPKPDPPRLVNDFTGTLSKSESAALEQKLVAYDDSTSTQIAVVMISTLDGYPIEDYAFSLGDTWGIGRKQKNNGVLVLIAKDDRQIFIATGYGMEGVMPDGLVKRIIENDIKPFFKEGRYYDGLNQGTDSMILLAAGEYTAESKSEIKENWPFFFVIGFFILMFILVLWAKVKSAKTYSTVNSIPFWTAWTLLNQARRVHHGSWGGFSGGSSWGGGGGGGFGGFGGGGFGGGGAGGSW
jgi:uncharacterized protein